MAVDFWADKYWNGQYFNTRYFGAGEEVAGAMSASISGSGGITATLTFVDNTVIFIDMDAGRRRDVKARRRKLYEAALRQSIEDAWARVFGPDTVAKPTPPQKDRIVSIVRRDLERRSVPIEATAKDLKVLIEAHAKRQRRQKRNRDAMITLLLAA